MISLAPRDSVSWSANSALRRSAWAAQNTRCGDQQRWMIGNLKGNADPWCVRRSPWHDGRSSRESGWMTVVDPSPVSLQGTRWSWFCEPRGKCELAGLLRREPPSNDGFFFSRDPNLLKVRWFGLRRRSCTSLIPFFIHSRRPHPSPPTIVSLSSQDHWFGLRLVHFHLQTLS